MMSLAVFAGPSLTGWEPLAWLQHAMLPPIRYGESPARLPGIESGGWHVAIIDGEFGQSLAVNVTENRAVLAAGNVVIGGASMGALRAVECEPLGMRAVGWIAEQYRTGALWADDEVALTYLPGDENKYRPITIPLINLRWLFMHVLKFAPARAAALSEACALVHFRERTPDRVAAVLESVDSAAAELVAEHLHPQRWLTWDRKRFDALEVVAAMHAAVFKGTRFANCRSLHQRAVPLTCRGDGSGMGTSASSIHSLPASECRAVSGRRRQLARLQLAAVSVLRDGSARRCNPDAEIDLTSDRGGSCDSWVHRRWQSSSDARSWCDADGE